MAKAWKKLAALSAVALGGVAAHDLTQKQLPILRNFPIVGHFRYLVTRIGPELRQYVVAANDEERPFDRDQRQWVYNSANSENAYVGFGTDNDVERNPGQPILKHRTFAGHGAPTAPHEGEGIPLPSPKVLGAARGRKHAFRPTSVVNVSGMSFGSLSGPAIKALNVGSQMAGCLHNTGEGAISPHHQHGGELVFQIGTSYFGCRDDRGNFDLSRLVDLVEANPVRAIEIKLSQGAKPGLGGMLPGIKVSEEIARTRGIPVGEDCASPSRHTAFTNVDEMLDFVETIADATGIPVGIKSAVGGMSFWDDLTSRMVDGTRGVDFVNIDGGEGGTGAAPLVFSDMVAYPFRIGFAEVYKRFAMKGLTDDVTFIGAGKLGLTENALVAFALGADMVNVGREAMLAIGCIQAQKCHTDHCPVGVATQNPRYTRGLVPEVKSERLANYVVALRRDLLKVSEAAGVVHPALVTPEEIDIVDGHYRHTPLHEVYGYEPGWGALGAHLQREVVDIMTGHIMPGRQHP